MVPWYVVEQGRPHQEFSSEWQNSVEASIQSQSASLIMLLARCTNLLCLLYTLVVALALKWVIFSWDALILMKGNNARKLQQREKITYCVLNW